ncbi:hypothetical protein [Geodermatophilus normandii]|nr:hypothetical protein [Geodermatophilus normandii]
MTRPPSARDVLVLAQSIDRVRTVPPWPATGPPRTAAPRPQVAT